MSANKYNKEQVREELEIELANLYADAIKNGEEINSKLCLKLADKEGLTKIEIEGKEIGSIEIIGADVTEPACAIVTFKGFEFTIDNDLHITDMVAVGEKRELPSMDMTAPTIEEIIPDTEFAKLTIKAKDNIGITGYYYNTSNQIDLKSIKWNDVEITDELVMKIENLEFDTTYYFWVIDESGNISSENNAKTTKLQKDKWQVLVEKAGLNPNDYDDFNSVLNNNSALASIFNSSDAIEYLKISNIIILPAALNNSNFRLWIYNNYNLTQPIIENSNEILNAMKATSQYAVIACSGQYKSFYNGKAFVLGFSTDGVPGGTYYPTKFLSGDFNWYVGGASFDDRWYYKETNGLAYKVNKFASSVSINGVWGSSYEWGNTMYVALFKI